MAYFSSFTDIGVYRNVIREITNRLRYKGKDEDGNPIYDPCLVLPTVKFVGTVKLHGTNSGVSMQGDEVWAQSRKRVITVEKDNHGFAQFVKYHDESFRKLLNDIKQKYDVTDDQIVTVFGEWCGKSIQRGVAISELDKMFVTFAVKILSKTEDGGYEGKYYPCDDVMRFPDEKIYNIMDYPTFEIDIDFSNPGESQNKIVELVEKVENECPVAKAFGVSGIGEGLVFTGWHEGERYVFKAKGEKHSVTKVKKLAKVDPEVLKNIDEFVEYAATPNRFEQAITEVFGEEPLDIRKTGEYLKWVNRDIVKEESDTLEANGLTMKQVAKSVSHKAKEYLMQKM